MTIVMYEIPIISGQYHLFIYTVLLTSLNNFVMFKTLKSDEWVKKKNATLLIP